jgi:hypothetical protein
LEPEQVLVIVINSNITITNTISTTIGFGNSSSGFIEFDGEGCITLGGLIHVHLDNTAVIRTNDRVELIQANCITADEGTQILIEGSSQADPCSLTSARLDENNNGNNNKINLALIFTVTQDPSCTTSEEDNLGTTIGMAVGISAAALLVIAIAIASVYFVKFRKVVRPFADKNRTPNHAIEAQTTQNNSM